MTISVLKPLLPTLLFVIGGAFLLVVSVLSARRGIGRGIGWLGGLAMLAVGLFGVVGLCLGLEAFLWAPALVLTGVYLCLFTFPSRALVLLSRSLRARLSTARARSFAVALSCGVAALVSLALYLTGAGVPGEELWLVPAPPPEAVALQDIENVSAFTDRGRRIVLKTNTFPNAGKLDPEMLRQQIDLLTRHGLRDQVILVSSGWQNCNCHGWVFTSGQFWVAGDQVDTILEDNRYRAVGAPRPGDVAVYRDDQEKVVHTGIVLCVNPASNLILVESKWGALGRFIHPHDMHAYGANDCTFYRSDRPGHRLHGVPFEGSAPVTEPATEYTPASHPGSLNPS